MSAMKFEIWKSEVDGQWYWHVVSPNGRIVADGGEGYHNQADAQLGAVLAAEGIREVFPVTPDIKEEPVALEESGADETP